MCAIKWNLLLFLSFSCLTVAPHFKRASSIGTAETAITHKPLTDVNRAVATGDGFRKPFTEVNHGVVAVVQKPYPGDNPGPVFLNESKCVCMFTANINIANSFTHATNFIFLLQILQIGISMHCNHS